jgi:hypothetical protein
MLLHNICTGGANTPGQRRQKFPLTPKQRIVMTELCFSAPV